jgi:hypothetical protein
MGVYDLLKNVQPVDTTNLNVLNVNKINSPDLTVNYSEGTVISCEYQLTLTQKTLDTLNQVLGLFGAPTVGRLQVINSPVKVYEIVYWGNDTRSNGLSKMSGILLIPDVVTKKYIVNHSHSLYQNLINKFTELNQLEDLVTNEGDLIASILEVTNGYFFTDGIYEAFVGAITIIPDGPSYGESKGLATWLDLNSYVYSVNGGILATRNLISKNPDSIFNNYSNLVDVVTDTIEVVVVGYSLGATISVSLASLIQKYSSDTKLSVKSLVISASINWTRSIYNFTKITAPGYYPVDGLQIGFSQAVIYLFYPVSTAIGQALRPLMRPNVISDVIPTIDNLFYDKNYKLGTPDPTLSIPENFLNMANTTALFTTIQAAREYIKTCNLHLILAAPQAPGTNNWLNPSDGKYYIKPWSVLPNSLGLLDYPADPDLRGLYQAYYTYDLRYVFNDPYEVCKYTQLFGNISWLTQRANNFQYFDKNNDGVPIPIVNISSILDDLIVDPNVVKPYFKSFITGEPVPQKYFTLWNVAGSGNTPPSGKCWKDFIHPSTLNRSVDLYSETQLNPGSEAEFSEIINEIVQSSTTGKSINIEVDTTNYPTIAPHAPFIYYYDSTILPSVIQQLE